MAHFTGRSIKSRNLAGMSVHEIGGMSGWFEFRIAWMAEFAAKRRFNRGVAYKAVRHLRVMGGISANDLRQSAMAGLTFIGRG